MYLAQHARFSLVNGGYFDDQTTTVMHAIRSIDCEERMIVISMMRSGGSRTITVKKPGNPRSSEHCSQSCDKLSIV